jgi:nitroreductase
MTVVELVRRSGEMPRFEPKAVGVELLKGPLEALRWTPSMAGSQPWEVYLVEKREARLALEGCLLDPLMRDPEPKAMLADAPLVLLFALDRKRARARFGGLGDSFLAVQDLAAAVSNFRLACAEAGLASSPLREVDFERAGRVLGLGASLRPVALLTAGLRAAGAEQSAPLPVEDWLHAI